jgi:lipoyl(octanoyl) transferase
VTVAFYDLGFVRFKEAWDVQRHLHAERVAGTIGDALLFCEHAPVITMGKSGRKHNLLVSADELRRRNVEYYDIERGGDLTYHGPGQLVCYPIFKLARLREVQGFVRKMEQSIILALNAFGVRGEQRPEHAGVFVGGAKIASIGAAVRGGVTFHGFALDVCTDLSYFQLINPCGMPDTAVTSISKEAGREVQVGEVKPPMRVALEQVYEIRLAPAVLQPIGMA